MRRRLYLFAWFVACACSTLAGVALGYIAGGAFELPPVTMAIVGGALYTLLPLVIAIFAQRRTK